MQALPSAWPWVRLLMLVTTDDGPLAKFSRCSAKTASENESDTMKRPELVRLPRAHRSLVVSLPQVNPVQPANQRDASAAPGLLPPASPRNPHPSPQPPSGGGSSPAFVDEAARVAAGNVSVGEQGVVDGGGKHKEGGESDEDEDDHDDDDDDDGDGDDGDQEEEEEEEEDEDEEAEEEEEQEEEEEEEEEDQSDYDGERAGSEEAGDEDRHDAVVVDLSQGSPTAPAPQASLRADRAMEQQALQAIIDDVASFSVGGEPPLPVAEKNDSAGDQGRISDAVASATAVLTEAERGARAARASAEAAAMQELSSKLFPLLVERLPGVLGQSAGDDDPSGEVSRQTIRMHGDQLVTGVD